MAVVDANEIKFKHPFTMKLSGNRRTGKTYFTKNLILKNKELITPEIDSIIWFYDSPQDDVFHEVKDQQHIEFLQGLPKSPIQDILERRSGRKLIVLDDLMEEASNRKDISSLFTNGRHQDVSVIFLSQNLFHKGKYSREIALNSDYMITFKNPRDVSIISNLGRQMGNTKFLQAAYQDATKEPFSHFFIDLRSDTSDSLRYRSDVLNDTQTVYQPTL